jgi:hypothetical protein
MFYATIFSGISSAAREAKPSYARASLASFCVICLQALFSGLGLKAKSKHISSHFMDMA